MNFWQIAIELIIALLTIFYIRHLIHLVEFKTSDYSIFINDTKKDADTHLDNILSVIDTVNINVDKIEKKAHRATVINRHLEEIAQKHHSVVLELSNTVHKQKTEIFETQHNLDRISNKVKDIENLILPQRTNYESYKPFDLSNRITHPLILIAGHCVNISRNKPGAKVNAQNPSL